MRRNYNRDLFKNIEELQQSISDLKGTFSDYKIQAEIRIAELEDTVSRQENEIDELKSENNKLRKDNERLKRRINNNSSNSSLPPSSDQKPSKPANTYNGRQKTGKRIGRVMDKGKNLMNTSGDVIGQWKSSVSGILDKCEGTLKNAENIMETLSQKTDKTIEDISTLKGRTEELLQKVAELKDSADAICSKLEQEDNTAGLILSGKGRFLQEINRISKDIDALIADIKKQGVKLNVDIF